MPRRVPAPTFNFSPYLPADAAERLPRYVYRAEDKSPLFNYVWRPLCRKTVSKVPVWLAPNVITLSALLLVIAVHVGFHYYMPLVVMPVNEHPAAVERMSIEAQRQALVFGVPYGSPEYRTLSDITGPAHQETSVPSTAPPTWLYLAGGITLLLYSYLDNLDGHQARRTGTSSPLGLLMDHGCDAINCVVGGISLASCCGCGPTWKAWLVATTTSFVFFFNTWEEYYRGALVLPFINGANEGVLVSALLYFVSSQIGTAFWLQYLSVPLAWLPPTVVDILRAIPVNSQGTTTNLLECLKVPGAASEADAQVGMMINTMLVLFMTTSALFTCLGNMYEVFVCTRRTKPGEEDAHGKYGSGWLVQHFPFIHAFTRLLPFVVVALMANLWILTSPSEIFYNHPRIVIWTFGLLNTKLVIHLMIAHLCEMEYHPLRRTMVPFLYLGGHALMSYVMRSGSAAATVGDLGGLLSDEETLLFEFFALSSVTFLHLVFNAVIEAATALNVNILTVPAEKQVATLKREAAENEADAEKRKKKKTA